MSDSEFTLVFVIGLVIGLIGGVAIGVGFGIDEGAKAAYEGTMVCAEALGEIICKKIAP